MKIKPRRNDELFCMSLLVIGGSEAEQKNLFASFQRMVNENKEYSWERRGRRGDGGSIEWQGHPVRIMAWKGAFWKNEDPSAQLQILDEWVSGEDTTLPFAVVVGAENDNDRGTPAILVLAKANTSGGVHAGGVEATELARRCGLAMGQEGLLPREDGMPLRAMEMALDDPGHSLLRAGLDRIVLDAVIPDPPGRGPRAPKGRM